MVDQALGLEFHKGTYNHCDSKGDEDAKMKLEKLYLLAYSLIEPIQKFEWLKWRNSK